MNVLVVVASRHGATEGIAEALADEIRARGHVVDVTSPAEAPPVSGYDAVVVGSGVYIGKWLKDAQRYLEGHQQELRARPTWLFSSGPVGEAAPEPKDDPQKISELMQLVQARGHCTFAGELDAAKLGPGERFIMWNVKRLSHGAVREGDFRDWAAIRAWADEISAALPLPARA